MNSLLELVVLFNKGLWIGFLLGTLFGALLASYLMFRD